MFDLVIRGGTIVDGTGGAPFQGDVAVNGGIIAAIGNIEAKGAREIDGTGCIVTPGFVDIHTHYDGQATWDQEMAPSSWHGVTTVVMGNCGVGFAPARPDRHGWLIGLMEGVEDIPGTALAEGMKWDWETFPEYLDALERLPRTVDVATHVPHGAVRAYVLGGREMPGAIPTDAEIAEMAAIVEDSIRAGALGFSTSRTALHNSIDGEAVPGTHANADELLRIGEAMGRAGHGVFELTSDFQQDWNDFGWMERVSKDNNVPVVFNMLQSPVKQMSWQEQMAATKAANDRGARLVAAIGLRGNGILMGWRTTIHPFYNHAGFKAIDVLPWDQKLAKLRDPAFRAALLAEEVPPSPAPGIAPLYALVTGFWPIQFPMGPDFDYEPQAEESIAALAAAAGNPPASFAYDAMMANDGEGLIYLPILNYMDGNLDFTLGLQQRDDTVNSLSDGGAHCGTICDAANTTFMLQHWVRDRTRGRISLEAAIKRQCRDTAVLYGLEDRGLLKAGMLADMNVIDLDRIKLLPPWMAYDLPAGGKRLLQKADGYVATVKSGVVTFAEGKATGAYPGGLIRGPQPMPVQQAAE